MDELLVFANKLSGVGFPTLLVAILYGSYKRVWVWGVELKRTEERELEWRTMALQATGLAETSVNIARTRP